MRRCSKSWFWDNMKKICYGEVKNECVDHIDTECPAMDVAMEGQKAVIHQFSQRKKKPKHLRSTRKVSRSS
jgi:hypothetical protein